MAFRVRLTLWYLVTLTMILVVFSSFIYWQTRRTLLAQIDTTLELAAAQSQINISGDDRPEFREVSTLLDIIDQIDNDLTLRLISNDGEVYQTVGHGSDDDEDEGPDYEDTFPAITPSRSPVTVQGEDHNWRVYSERLESETWLQVGQSLELLEDNLNALLTQIVWGVPLALLVAGAGGYFLASGALRPVVQITKTAQSITERDLTQRIAYQGVQDEIGRLATTFDTMLDRLESAFKRERRFTNDAAHELRTPLTALKGHIDVTLSQPRTAAAYITTLNTLNAQVDRLINLTRDLLFLARLDQGQLINERAVIDLIDFLPSIVELMRPLAEEKTLMIVERIEPLTVTANTDLLIQCILNLLDNAIKYSEPHGTVTIQAFAEQEMVAIRISDTGQGITAEHLPHLFERFYRVDPSRTRAEPESGNGLGLAITKEIVEGHDGRVDVTSTDGVGAAFTIYLPNI